MTMTFIIGYGTKTVTLDQLHVHPEWMALDPGVQQRAEWLLVESALVGKPLGIGDVVREESGQLAGALCRHHLSAPGEKPCCTYQGKHYTKNVGVAHMTFPPNSWHLRQPPNQKARAIDWIGNLKWLEANCHRVKLHTFTNVNNEPWHTQPDEIPNGVAAYRANMARYGVTPIIQLPPHSGVANPAVVDAPTPTLAYGRANNIQEVRELQAMCNFFGWKSDDGRVLTVDGSFGLKTKQAVMNMQRALGFVGGYVDGIYGTMSARRLQSFLSTGKAA